MHNSKGHTYSESDVFEFLQEWGTAQRKAVSKHCIAWLMIIFPSTALIWVSSAVNPSGHTGISASGCTACKDCTGEMCHSCKIAAIWFTCTTMILEDPFGILQIGGSFRPQNAVVLDVTMCTAGRLCANFARFNSVSQRILISRLCTTTNK